MQMIFKLTVDFIQHLIHQHCCHTRRAHSKWSASTGSELNRSKNPVLISPAWIVSFLVVEKSFSRFQAEAKNGKKLDNERYASPTPKCLQSSHIS